MKKDDKASISLVKILGISLILIFITGIGVMASNAKLTNVKIVLSSNYEMTVLTSKTKVADILDENHITVLEDEIVVPGIEEEISENKTIKISKIENQEQQVAEEEESVTTEKILANYDNITQRVVTEQEVIPFETITKEATGEGTKQNQVIQKGKDGLKEVTYKITYSNDVEIERTQISETIIREPVDKIVEVRTIQITSRGGERSSSVSYSNGKWSYSDEELDLLCAITSQECNSSYTGALAVITCACNRAESSRWRNNGTDPLSQFKAKGQFCYSIDSHWKKRLNGNYPAYIKQAVLDALAGKRNHNYLSFRSAGSHSGENIGGNVYFNAM